ncbi:FxSxx-COOH system tetratricopeptide repeat protein [Nonomuraea sp. NPDC050540]|uniref:FxSxx-COOH system tetratricopeptide repeat protein n=1 Tax=Nonomuraea sp. NPDC050540 TaxID=3364367 RepID=UPI00379BFC24
MDEGITAPAVQRYLNQATLPDEPWTERVERGLVITKISLGLGGRSVYHAVTDDVAIDLGAMPFDYVLLNARPGPQPPPMLIHCGHVVVCFTLTPRAIDEALALTTLAREGGVSVLPLPTKVDLQGGPLFESAWQVVQSLFSPPPDIRISYSPDYSYSDALAALVEPSGSGGLRAQFERLVEELTHGAVTTLDSVAVVHQPNYEVWAEWLGALIGRWGLRVPVLGLAEYLEITPVDLRAGTARSAVLLLGPAVPELVPRHQAPSGRGLFSVLLEADKPGQSSSVGTVIDLRGLDEAGALAEVQERLGLPRSASAVRAEQWAARYPGNPVSGNLPERNQEFVGREVQLAEIRRLLDPGWSGAGECLVYGEEASGKSELVVEFAHRFGHAYDSAHWIHAADVYDAREGLRQFAEILDVPAKGDAVAALLRHLASPESSRWLLIFDDVDDPATLEGLIPAGRHGHVIITSRKIEAWAGRFDRGVEASTMTADEAAHVLGSRQTPLGRIDADTVARTVGHRPLALSMVKAWFALSTGDDLSRNRFATVVEQFLWTYTQVESELRREAAESTEHGVMVEMMLRLLANRPLGVKALWLLELCGFAAADGLPLRLLRSSVSRAYAAEVLPLDHGDELTLDVMLRTVHQHRLATLRFGPTGALRMHRVTAALIRARMSNEAVLERRGQVLTMLAWYAPTDIEGAGAAQFAELVKHLEPAGALLSTDEMVRSWVVNQVRYQYLLGDRSSWLRGRAIGLAALELWSGHQADLQPHLLNDLRIQLANLARALGEHATAFTLTQLALQQLSSAGSRHPLRYIAAQAHAADLRVLGDFDEAYRWDQLAYEGMLETLGPEHAWTGRQMNNLALSLALSGHPHAAAELAGIRIRERLLLYGEADPAVWRTVVTAGVLLRALGRYNEAYDLQRRGLAAIARSLDRAGRRSLLALRLATGVATSERLLGRPYEALATDLETFEELRALAGEANIYTVLCRAGLAADLHARGESMGAVVHGRAVLAALAAQRREHPYTYAAGANLACYLSAVGDAEQAFALANESFNGLHDQLGARHPYTLLAASTFANQTLDEDPASALNLDRMVHDNLNELFGAQHPWVVAAAANLTDTRHLLARSPRGEQENRHALEIEILGY